MAYGDFKDIMKKIYQSTYTDFSKANNNREPQFKIGDIVRISKYKNIFTKGYTPNWCEEVVAIKKVKNTVPLIYVINDLNREEIVATFYENELQKNKSKRI